MGDERSEIGWGMKNEHRKERISSFEDLEAWQAAQQLVNAILPVLTRLSKVSGDFRLSSQVQAAAVSIMSNIAEEFRANTPSREDPVLQCRARFSG